MAANCSRGSTHGIVRARRRNLYRQNLSSELGFVLVVSADATSAIQEARSARARGDVKHAVKLLNGAIEPLATSGNADGLREIADEAESIAAAPEFRRSAEYVARRARSQIPSTGAPAASAAPTDYDTIPEKPWESVLASEMSDLMPEINRLQAGARRGMWWVRLLWLLLAIDVVAGIWGTIRFGVIGAFLAVAGIGVLLVLTCGISAFNMLLNRLSYGTWTKATYANAVIATRLSQLHEEGKLSDDQLAAIRSRMRGLI